MTIIWIIVFIISLAVLILGADWLLESAQKIGLKLGLSPFVVGVTIIGVGTSLPELISSLVATFNGLSGFAVDNAVGSNIANILLVVGLATLFAKKLQVSKDLINLDLPLLAISTTIFLLVAMDGNINFFESLFLIATYIIYLGYTVIYRDEEDEEDDGEKTDKINIAIIDYVKLVGGILALYLGSKYLIDAVSAISLIYNISPGLITITAVAIGTSLPEIVVSVKAAIKKQYEVALGNVLGSNIFNVLVVVGLPGIFRELVIDAKTLSLGLPVLIASTILFIFSGISKRVHAQEGALFLLLYIIFTAKLFGLF